MWGIVPAAGVGSRIQPLAFSKELLPVGSRLDGDTERTRAVSEYLIERMVRGGARKICFVISSGPHEPAVIGLPDTVWFPEDALRELPDDRLSSLLANEDLLRNLQGGSRP